MWEYFSENGSDGKEEVSFLEKRLVDFCIGGTDATVEKRSAPTTRGQLDDKEVSTNQRTDVENTPSSAEPRSASSLYDPSGVTGLAAHCASGTRPQSVGDPSCQSHSEPSPQQKTSLVGWGRGHMFRALAGDQQKAVVGVGRIPGSGDPSVPMLTRGRGQTLLQALNCKK